MQRHETEQKDKVPVFEKLMYGAGSGSYQLCNDGVKGLANPIYNITLGLDLALLGLIMMITRLFDAFNDPVMAKISDDFRSRWGRRRPIIFVGSFLAAAAFVVVWMVPETWKGQTSALFVYCLLSMLLFEACATVQVVPYHTLGLEMTPDYDERTSVSGYKMIFSFAFTLLVPWVFRLAQSDRFGGNVMAGMRYWSFIIAAMIVAGGILPAIFVKERYYKLAVKQSKIGFWPSLKTTLQNRSFLRLTGLVLLTGFGSGLVGAFGPYLVYFYIFDGDTKVGQTLVAQGSNIFSILALVSTPAMIWLSARVGKTRMLTGLITLGLATSALTLVCYSRAHPRLIFIIYALQAPFSAGFWTITESMKADICDDDERRHGRRREAMFGAVGNWVTKAALSSTHFFSGLMLNAAGLDIALKGNQAPGTFLSMRLLFAFVPIVSSALALGLLWRYPLGASRMAEIRAALEARRSTVT